MSWRTGDFVAGCGWLYLYTQYATITTTVSNTTIPATDKPTAKEAVLIVIKYNVRFKEILLPKKTS